MLSDPRDLTGASRSPAGAAIAEVFRALGELTRAIGRLVAIFIGAPLHPGLHLKEELFMFIVKDNNPDVRYSAAFAVTDEENQPITDPAVLAGLLVEVISDNPDVVTVTPDPADPRAGSAHFGAPGLASVNAIVKKADGTLIGSFGAQFTVTAGDPAAISGGTLAFEGLTEAPETPPV